MSLFLTVNLSMFFAGFNAVFRRMDCMGLGNLGVVRAGLVVAGFVMFGRFLMMRGCQLVMLGSFLVMLLNGSRVCC
jgi:hypothetical protein